MAETICKLFLCFAVFSFAGWVMETLLYIARDGKVVKRGFLFGPVCPIYGCGTLIATAILKTGITNTIWIFIIGLILCGILEYVTHFLMEKAFHAMWWDYSDRALNIKGRVYFKGLIFFGVGMLLLVKVLLPPFYYALDVIPDWGLYLLTFIIYTVLVIDCTTTVVDLSDTVKILKKAINNTIDKGQSGVDEITGVIENISDKYEENVDKAKDKLMENSTINSIVKSVKSEHKTINKLKRRYPNFNIQEYKETFVWYFGPDKDTKGKDGVKLHGTGGVDEDNK